ncbi:MAG: hypothetical protein AB7P20_26165 [Rhizobiaceae bacterium]
MTGQPSLYALLANYWQCYDALSAAFAATDNASTEAEKSERQRKQSVCSDILDGAAIAICAYVPTTLADARIKAAFVQEHSDRNDRLTDEEISALVDSIALVFAPQKPAEDGPRMVGGERHG